jgi:hypothetical protein
MILKAPSRDIMNKLARSALVLYSYDESADDVRIENNLRQAVELIARSLICHNVIQIGLVKVATFSQQGSPFTFAIPEGQGTSIGMNVDGIGITVSLTVASIETDEVTVEISGTGTGTSTRVSKTQIYIPRAFYH